MDGLLNRDKVVCCFCGDSLLITKAIVLNIQASIHSDEVQSLFCHKHHLVELINKSIPLHPVFSKSEGEDDL